MIGTGDALDVVVLGSFDVSFCEEGLSDAGAVAFIARVADDSIPATTRT